MPPPAPPLGVPALLALSGGRNGIAGQVSLEGLEKYCKKKEEKKPPAPPKSPPIGGGGAAGGGAGGGAAGCAGGCGGSNGDPHLTTLDGRFYDFQAAGEFTLIRSRKDSLEVQVREEPYPGAPNLAINTAVALRVGSDRVVVSRGQPLSVQVGGRGFLVPARPARLAGGGRIAMVRDQVEVVWPDSTVARIWSVGTWGVAVLVKPVAARKGTLSGLLGDFDGNQDNDFKTRGGRALGEVADSRRKLYGVFGESWRITQRTSLFDYAPGQSTRTFTNRSIPHEIVITASLSPSARRRAEAACRSLKIRDSRIFQACVLDVAGTGDNRFATAGATLQQTGVSFAPSKGGGGGGGGGGARGDETWTQISTGGSNGIAPSLATDGGKVVVAYGSGGRAEAATFTPSLSQDVVDLRRDTITSGWGQVTDPVLLPRPGGGLQALFGGISSNRSGAYFAARNPDGSFGAPALAFGDPATGGAAVLAPDGQPLWASTRGGLSLLHGSANATQVFLDTPGTAYIPSVGRDRSGRYWLAWYAIGPPNGIRMVQIDPTSLKRLGPVLRAPASSPIENNSTALALACAATCRVAYLEPDRRLVAWAPGEASAALVALGANSASGTFWVTAVYLPSGRLWIAWYDRKQNTYRAVTGDAAGRGGEPVSMGAPAGVGGFGVAAAVAGDKVVVVTNWNTSTTSLARYVNVVKPK